MPPFDDRSIVIGHPFRVTAASTGMLAASPVASNRPFRRAACQTRSMRVVVAEDVMLMREGIVRVLRDEGVEVVAESADVPGLMGALAKHEPDCAIVDIRLPPSHTDEGAVAAPRIRRLP